MFKRRLLPWILVLGYLGIAALVAIFPATVIRGDISAALEARKADLVEVSGTLIKGEVGTMPRGQRSVRAVRVSYAYQFDGQEYIGTRLCFGASQEGSFSTQELEAKFERARTRGEIPVYVNRNEPDRAVLLPDRDGIITPVTVILIIGPGLFVFLALLGLWNHVSRWVRGDHWWIRGHM